MGIHNVTLEGFGGWTLPLIFMGVIFALWLVGFLLMGRIPRARWRGDENGDGDWRWYLRFYSILGLVVIEFAILLTTLTASTGWDDEQRAEAIESVGVENVEWDSKDYARFVGTVDEDIVFGYLLHIEGENWRLIVGDSK